MVFGLIGADSDTPTLRAWAACLGMSTSAVRQHCYAVRVRPKCALDFARLLRAVTRANGSRWDAADWLVCASPGTLARLLKRGGLPPATAVAPALAEYLDRQGFVPQGSGALRALRCALARSGHGNEVKATPRDTSDEGRA
jgi:hypothetical protein